MKNKASNPFITAGYIAPEYFCNRQYATNHLLKAIESKRNITLISLRRMGKTGLLKHLQQLLEKEKRNISVVYIDLMPTMNGNEMLNAISSALLRVRKNEKNFFEKVLALLASLRPKITYDSLTGQPVIELKVESTADIQFGFEHLLHFVSDIKQDIVFMFDEFQQITRYPEKNIEQLLRSVIQTSSGMSFIFSGSSKHMLEPMFSAAGRPFYQSTELMYLDKIDEEDYRSFINTKFHSAGKKIDTEAISKIFSWTRLHTYYVQYVCNLLFEEDQPHIETDLINRVFQRVLTSYEPMFASYHNLIPTHQYSLLQAIAVENSIDKPTSGSFIQQYNLNSASSVKTSLNALADKEMIVQSGKSWQVYDVFFSRWLEYHFGGR